MGYLPVTGTILVIGRPNAVGQTFSVSFGEIPHVRDHKIDLREPFNMQVVGWLDVNPRPEPRTGRVTCAGWVIDTVEAPIRSFAGYERGCVRTWVKSSIYTVPNGDEREITGLAYVHFNPIDVWPEAYIEIDVEAEPVENP